MWGSTAKKLNQFMRLASTLALTGFAFAVGVGVGALALTAQYAVAADGAASHWVAEVELTASREAWGAYGASVGREALNPAEDVHTVASALRVELPRNAAAASGPLYSTAAVAKMVPGERAAATVTFYYCSGPAVGDGGGFCGHAADGTPVQPGVASCDRRFMGQKFRVVNDPTGMVFRCADTGGGVFGQMRDIWFPTAAEAGVWMAAVGHHVTVEVLD